ncbi:MAG: PilZ domain-containing protein [Candidatus Methylomirabilales bacterium]
MGNEQRDKRVNPRVFVEGKAKGRVAAACEGSLLNISLGGALIEHVHALSPGTLSSVELELQGKQVRLPCRVARSVADRTEVQPDGERAMIYHSGLEFLDVPEEMRQAISDYIEPRTEERPSKSERVSDPEPDPEVPPAPDSEPKESLLAELEKLERLLKEASKKFEEDVARTDGTV